MIVLYCCQLLIGGKAFMAAWGILFLFVCHKSVLIHEGAAWTVSVHSLMKLMNWWMDSGLFIQQQASLESFTMSMVTQGASETNFSTFWIQLEVS